MVAWHYWRLGEAHMMRKFPPSKSGTTVVFNHHLAHALWLNVWPDKHSFCTVPQNSVSGNISLTPLKNLVLKWNLAIFSFSPLYHFLSLSCTFAYWLGIVIPNYKFKLYYYLIMFTVCSSDILKSVNGISCRGNSKIRGRKGLGEFAGETPSVAKA